LFLRAALRSGRVVSPPPAAQPTRYSPHRSVLALSMRLMVALLNNYCRYEAQILGSSTRDKHPYKGESAVINLLFWSWLVHKFGVSGALLSYVMMLSRFVTPILLILLYRKRLGLERRIIELGERLASQTRQQQGQRIKRDG